MNYIRALHILHKPFLDGFIYEYAQKIDAACEKRRMQKKRVKFGHYYHPAKVVCCCTGYSFRIGKGVACAPIEKSFHFKIKNLLVNRLGNDLGKSSIRTSCKFPIGHCAEPHAANNYLKTCNSIIDPESDLFFSTPYRPRILNPLNIYKSDSYCDNCKLTFINCN